MKRRTPESYVMGAVTDLLDAERVWYMRCNSGIQVLTDAKGRRRVIRGHRSGTADLLAFADTMMCAKCYRPIRTGEWCANSEHRVRIKFIAPLWIEFKAAKGRQSPAQKEFQAEVEAQGHRYVLARSSDDVLRALKEQP